MRNLLIPLLLLLTLPASADFLKPYKATYRFSMDNGLTANATRELEQLDKERYRYKTLAESAMIASARESSEFILGKNNYVTPLRYDMQRKVFFRSKASQLLFNWRQNMLYSSENGKSRSFALPAGALDKLSVELQLRQDLMAGKKKLIYPLADADGVGNYEYRLDGSETLETPFGRIETLRLEKVHKPGSTRKTTFWVAPKYQYLPAKVVQVEKDTSYQLLLTGLEYSSAAANTESEKQ